MNEIGMHHFDSTVLLIQVIGTGHARTNKDAKRIACTQGLAHPWVTATQASLAAAGGRAQSPSLGLHPQNAATTSSPDVSDAEAGSNPMPITYHLGLSPQQVHCIA